MSQTHPAIEEDQPVTHPDRPGGDIASPRYHFFSRLARIVNSGESRSLIVSGNIHDLYYSANANKKRGGYVTLVEYLSDRCRIPGLILLVYELNGPIRLQSTEGRDTGWRKLQNAWISWKYGLDPYQLMLEAMGNPNKHKEREQLEADFERNVHDVVGRPTFALEFLRQITLCSRAKDSKGDPHLDDDLLIVIEAADMMLPAGQGNISALASPDRHRISICEDWFSEPTFMNGNDTVVMLCESASLIHPRVAKLPAAMTVEAQPPDEATRRHYIEWFCTRNEAPRGLPESPGRPSESPVKMWAGRAELARTTAGLSIHALRQMLIGAAHDGKMLSHADVVARVESYIASQLGDDVVEFKKPAHTLDDVVGFSRLKEFINDELLPRFQASGADALPGAAVAGPIGGGKTFIFEAVAASLDLPVLVLKNIRSQWFGQTDVIFERLRRVLESLGKVVIFVDEADTQFGGIDAHTHDTERRLTGKVQQMMSDPKLRGKVIWLLMTARIHRLSPDIRRPGRVGDLIIPILDPEGDDRKAFLRWTLKGTLDDAPTDDQVEQLSRLTEGYSAAAFAALRSRLRAVGRNRSLEFAEIERIVHDQLPPDIASTRRYQTLQALLNCTRRSLLPDPEVSDEERERWQRELRELEAQGIE